MDIETNMEQMADQQDAFLDGWDDFADQQSESEEEFSIEDESEAETESETTDDGNAEQESPTETDSDTANTEQEQETETTKIDEWVIKHMGEEQKLTAADITPELLQKGKDYDRIRAKYDEAKPIVELFSSFAEKAKMSIPEYVKALRAEAKRAEGMSEAEAVRTIELEDREAAVAAAEAAKQGDEQAKNEAKAKVQADLDLFSKLYPNIYEQAKSNPSVIPKSVWDEVNAGESLPVAYKKYADEQAAAEKQQMLDRVAAAERGAKNAVRSTGSMKSAGNDTKNTDPFLDGWD